MKNNDDLVIENVKITNPEKLVYEDAKITKKEIIEYYQKVGRHMLPYLKNRIISTIRCPDGINGTCFYKKHLDQINEGIGKINLPDKENDDYYYIKDISGIILEAQMNTIEFHPWGSTIKNLNKPDIMVFDLDPDENLSIKDVRQGVKDLKSILDNLSLTSFLKTSGGKGYHVLVPFIPSANWDTFRTFAKNIAELMEEKWPDKYTSNVRLINRKNKIFIDWIRNTKESSCVAPYSLRIKKNATVSMPIAWNELDKIAPDSITMTKAIKRLKRKDPWENFFEINQKIKK